MFTDKKIPRLIGNDSSVNILDVCSKEQWNAQEGAIGTEARLVIDTNCPLKLSEVQLLNGIEDFSTKGFTILGSYNITGPWKKLYSGELETGRGEVGGSAYI